MDSREKISSRQFMALAFVALLSPIVRRMPRSLVMLSGGACWLAVPLAALPCLLIFLLVHRCLRDGRGLGALLELALGKAAGRAVLLVSALWLSFYCGFLLHSAAHRMLSSVYSDASALIFILLTAALCQAAAMGPFCALGRFAMLFRPLLLGVLAALSLFALGNCSFAGVLSLRREDLLPAAESGFAVLNTLSLVVYLAFAVPNCEGRVKKGPFVLWCLLLLLIVELMVLGCLGIFGTELTLKLNYPFFMLVRDISIFDSLARMEALVIALWMVTDFQLVSLLLRIASHKLGMVFPGGEAKASRLRSLCPGLLATAVAVAIPGDLLSLGRLSEALVPAANAALIFVIFPLSLLIGRLRGRL